MEFIDKYGLTNSKPLESGAENGFIWTLETIILEEMTGRVSQKRISDFKASVDKCRVSKGIYLQNPSQVEKKPANLHDMYMSPDQLVSICLMSYKYGWNDHTDIWEEIKRQTLRYDNINPESPERYIHPRDLILYGHLAGNKICSMLMFALGIACVVSCKKERPHTSGKLLSFIKLSVLKDNIVMRIANTICTKIVNKIHGSWADVFKIYFPIDGHPNAELAKEVFDGK